MACERVATSLQDHDNAALRADVAVGPMIESPAQSVWREHGRGREAHEIERAEQAIDATDDRRVYFSGIQVLHGVVERDQRGRTRCVDRKARSRQIKLVGNSVGNQRQRIAGHQIRIGPRGIEILSMAVVHRRGAHIDANIPARERGRGDAGVFERFPDKLKHETLLRIHLARLARRNGEHRRIEAPDVVDHSRSERIGLPRSPRRR